MQHETSRNPKQFTLPNAIIQDDTTNWTSLHDAAANGDEKKLLALLAGKVDRMSKESNNGNTPLHEAASRGYSRCVKILCAPPHANSDLKDKKRKGTFQETIEALHSSILDIQNFGGFSALHLAVQNGHNQSCRELLLAGTDPNRQNYYGDTALHTACRYGHAGACRILLSAFCNLNKLNVNGDSPLHISCAMGRHKITRILLEANCETYLTNAQHETPRDIAIRKNYGKILDILNNPHRMRNKKEKCNNLSSTSDVGYVNGINWSPYGCHYFPDPRSFPSPKLETLPKEPLKKGEQYFLDLSGHIRKGPIGIGNACYCKPFFRHIEDEIISNQKIIRRYVNYTNESMGCKVQDLASRTNNQIEHHTRSMVTDRIQCESKRFLLNHCLKRGDSFRFSAKEGLQPYMNQQRNLKRCRSLELLHNDKMSSRRLHNANSWDVLKETTVANNHTDKPRENKSNCNATACPAPLDDIWNYKNGKFLEKSGWHELEKDYYNVSRRLEHLLAKTNVFLEIKKDTIKQLQQASIKDSVSKTKKRNKICFIPLLECVNHTKFTKSNNNINVEKDENITFKREIEQYHSHTSLHCDNYVVHNLKKSSVSCESLNISQHLDRCDQPELSNLKNEGYDQYFTDIKNNEHILQSFICALRKDKITQLSVESKTLNESEHLYENKLSYKDDKTLLKVNELFQKTLKKDEVSESNQPNILRNTNDFTERASDSEPGKLIRQKIDFKIYQPMP